MWLIGVLLLMILVGVIAGLLSKNRNTPRFAADFDLASLTEAYAKIVAPLGGFSVAAGVFLANLSRVAETSSYVNVMALFLIAFIMLMGSALMYATFQSARLQSLPERHQEIHSMHFIVCNLMFFLSLSMSWLGLRPLLKSIGLASLGEIFTWVLLFTLLVGSIRLGAWLHTLLGVNLFASLFVPLFSIAAAAIYGLSFAQRLAIFWPDTNPVLSFAILIFALGGVALGVETSMIIFYGNEKLHHLLHRIERRVIVPYLVVSITAIGLLWFSVASV